MRVKLSGSEPRFSLGDCGPASLSRQPQVRMVCAGGQRRREIPGHCAYMSLYQLFARSLLTIPMNFLRSNRPTSRHPAILRLLYLLLSGRPKIFIH